MLFYSREGAVDARLCSGHHFFSAYCSFASLNSVCFYAVAMFYLHIDQLCVFELAADFVQGACDTSFVSL